MSTLPGNPESRIEQLLANIAGVSTEIPSETFSRVEEWLKYIAENGGGSGVSWGSIGGILSNQTDLSNELDSIKDDIDEKEDANNKVTAISAQSTDSQYPSAKCIYTLIGNIESLLEALL